MGYMDYFIDDYKAWTEYKDMFTYYVNEKKKIVVCKLTPRTSWTNGEVGMFYIRQLIEKQPMPEFMQFLVARLFTYEVLEKMKDVYPRPEQLVGVAKCSKEDAFDVDKGKAIARKRLEIKLTNQALNIFSMVSKELKNQMYRLGAIQGNHLCTLSKFTDVDEIAKYWGLL